MAAAKNFLASVGLELHPSKTRIAHTLNKYEQEERGFNFPGFSIRQYAVGKHHSKRGYKTLIKPQKEKVQTHHQKLAGIIVEVRAKPQDILIKRLNPVIKGWSNYYSAVVSKEIFTKLDFLLYWNLRNWDKRRHSNKTEKWLYERYWRRIQKGDYDANTFATSQESKRAC